MLQDALTGIEQTIQDTLGTVPVVFKSLTRNYQSGESTDTMSCHRFHELSYISSVMSALKLKERLRAEASILIRPGTKHRYCVQDGMADITVVYFGFAIMITKL